jgi:hypothetical protein
MVKRFQKKKNSAGGRKTNLGPVGFISLEESLTLYMYKGYGNARSTIFDYSLCCIREIDMRVLLSFLHQCILWVLLFCLSLVYIFVVVSLRAKTVIHSSVSIAAPSQWRGIP